MTDRDHLPNEIASAYLDDELSVPERRNAEADPAVMARVEVFASVRRRVQTAPAPTPDADHRERAIMAALGAADGIVVAMRPVEVSSAHRPSRRQRWAFALGGAAAAGLLVVVGLAALGDGGSSNTQAGGQVESAPSSTAAARTADTPGSESSGGEMPTAQDNTASVTSAPTPAAAPPIAATRDVIGSADTADELRRLLTAKLAPDADPIEGQTGAACPSVPGAQVALITWQGQPAVVVRTGVAWVVLAVTGCQVLAEVPLA
ncbi:MAG TPA: hypothetical protein VF855_02070 [Acidimicrobiales bacterium]